jgi:capsular polysaccharide transport system ATP-binding protein
MIELTDVVKDYQTRSGKVRILDKINLQVQPGQQLGILGRNGAGKSTMIRLISGTELPTSGTVRRTMTVSWPLAFGGAFQGTLTGYDNLRFICRVYGVNPENCIDFVQDFSELGIYLREPLHSYSSGMRARLAFCNLHDGGFRLLPDRRSDRRGRRAFMKSA